MPPKNAKQKKTATASAAASIAREESNLRKGLKRNRGEIISHDEVCVRFSFANVDVFGFSGE